VALQAEAEVPPLPYRRGDGHTQGFETTDGVRIPGAVWLVTASR